VVVSLFDRALSEADAADAARAHEQLPGPLHGVPVTIEKQFLVGGTPTTVGLPSRVSHRAAQRSKSGRLRTWQMPFVSSSV
jgi:Asp-tRNA(Asn)/Glu-tRNA(Gln) amidotransferase A subunit family amidase